jgi:hypothetical protein
VLIVPKFDLFANLFGAYPRLLRELNKVHPNLLAQLSPTSRLGKAIASALENSNRPEFDVQRENATRVQMVKSCYEEKLKRKRHRTNQSAKVELTAKENEDEKRVQPIGDVRFMKLVKDAGIRYRKKNVSELGNDNGLTKRVMEVPAAQGGQSSLEQETKESGFHGQLRRPTPLHRSPLPSLVSQGAVAPRQHTHRFRRCSRSASPLSKSSKD